MPVHPDSWEMHNIQDGARSGRGGPVGGRRFSVSSDREAAVLTGGPPGGLRMPPGTSEDLHAWSIYRQNLNSDFTDSALGSTDKSPLPYGNFQLRESTMQSILNNPKYGPRSELGTNMYTYLKFGLPRVLPPGKEEGIENSSGYDSTDEEAVAGRRNTRAHARLRSARSEEYLDKRSRGEVGRDGRSSAAGIRYNRDQMTRSKRGTMNGRSVSEANLLSDSYYDHQPTDLNRKEIQRRDQRGGRQGDGYINHGMVDDERSQSRLRHDDTNRKSREALDRSGLRSRAASQMSVASRQSKAKPINNGALSYRHDAPMLNDKYFPKDTYGSLANMVETEDYEGFKYPHLQLRNISYSVRRGRKEERLLDSINVEARGGELVAVLATRSDEGTALCKILANKHNGVGNKLRGDIIINGINVAPSRLSDRVALVERDTNFTQDMSVRQTLLLHSLLREPGTLTRGRDTKGRINALIEDLGLSQVKHTRVADLTLSEKQRLNVACHLLLDTDIVLLDQPTEGMDIFDTFFLVEYLRQWAARGRIVILTIHPPTYEIFTMISKVILISAGQLMYFGKRREMLPYFAFIEYPCPAYKNPSDYYLDLVTLDDLSSEALLESSQRVDQLSAVYQRKSEPLSDPGPPGILPPKIKRANVFMQVCSLWIRAMIYMYPFNVISWVKLIILSGIMSLCLGGIFVGIRWRYWDRIWQRDHNYGQENVNDRLGFHHVMMAIGVWPMLLCLTTEVWREKQPVHRDVEDKLYSKFSYVITKTLYGLPSSVGVAVAYIVPAYLLAGLHYPNIGDLTTFYLYIGYMLLYLLTLRSMTVVTAHLLPSHHLAVIVLGILLLAQSMVSGYLIHTDDLPVWVSWIRYVSPQYWMSQPILERELLPVKRFHCPHNPMINDGLVIKQVDCGLRDGQQALRYFSSSSISLPSSVTSTLSSSPSTTLPLSVTGIFLGVTTLVSIILFLVCKQHRDTNRKSRLNHNKI